MHNGNQFKLIKYDYDLISGRVNQVSYQPGKTDAFYHQYAYDAENRITEVFTSRDSTEWQHDADYQTPLMTSLVSYDITHKWYYYSGANNEGHRPGWYSQQDYEDIVLDWENGQVMLPYVASKWDNISGNNPYKPSGDIQRPGPGRNWFGQQVDEDGYLTGNPYPKSGVSAGLNLMEWIGPPVLKGRAFLKTGEYFLYYGYKDVELSVGGEAILEKRLYIGSTDELLKRYSQKEIRKLGSTMFEFFEQYPAIRMPNRGIAIGFEQMVLQLNNEGKTIIKGAPWLSKLANKINAARKKAYIEAAEKWAAENIPNWRELFKKL